MIYEITRHGGYSYNNWRVVFRTEDEEEAKKRFWEERDKMRQGGVRLMKDGQVLLEVTAPRLRTRW